MEQMMDVSDVARRCNAMWVRLGKLFEAHAYTLAKSANGFDRDKAIDFAKAAEGCFWQSTGDNDCFDLKRD
jgi:hypothetical protein